MDTGQLQALIHSADTAEKMHAIAQSYLEGTVLQDSVAAEAWLLRAIELGDSVESVRAMGTLAKLLGKTQILPPSELPELRRRLETATGQEKILLEALLELNNHSDTYEKTLQK
ncbi:MAG: hypothetical protein E7466_07920 [Ruminococcaceae bacterium]|nr:hypothetical protein [Oscillospiraceae bacterium]MBQ3214519.1 hypothetical protein [Oscillospiraceae bacterium]